MSAIPSFVSLPAFGVAIPTSADTNRDSAAAPVTVLEASANGTRVDRLRIVSAGTVGVAASANVVRWWIYNGTAWFPHLELAVATFTPTASAKGYDNTQPYVNGLMLKSGMKLGCTVHTYAGAQDKYAFHAEGGDL